MDSSFEAVRIKTRVRVNAYNKHAKIVIKYIFLSGSPRRVVVMLYKCSPRR